MTNAEYIEQFCTAIVEGERVQVVEPILPSKGKAVRLRPEDMERAPDSQLYAELRRAQNELGAMARALQAKMQFARAEERARRAQERLEQLKQQARYAPSQEQMVERLRDLSFTLSENI